MEVPYVVIDVQSLDCDLFSLKCYSAKEMAAAFLVSSFFSGAERAAERFGMVDDRLISDVSAERMRCIMQPVTDSPLLLAFSCMKRDVYSRLKTYFTAEISRRMEAAGIQEGRLLILDRDGLQQIVKDNFVFKSVLVPAEAAMLDFLTDFTEVLGHCEYLGYYFLAASAKTSCRQYYCAEQAMTVMRMQEAGALTDYQSLADLVCQSVEDKSQMEVQLACDMFLLKASIAHGETDINKLIQICREGQS